MSKGKLKGWRGIGPNSGKYVAAEDGFSYVRDRVGITLFDHVAPEADDFKEMLIEWYFSGNWIEVYKEDES
jgi:hypothetical protein